MFLIVTSLMIISRSVIFTLFHSSFGELLVECVLTASSYDNHYQKNREVLDPSCHPKRSDYGLPEDKFIFACFNQLYKMDPDIVNTW